VIDLHSHILPGLDDGASTLEESVSIAWASWSDGVEVMAATPHVRDDYPTSAEQMEQRLSALREELERQSLPLHVVPGGEIALGYLDRLSPEELRRFGLAANPACVLLEFPYTGWPLGLLDQIGRLTARGISPVLAHPERSPDVQADARLLEAPVEAGALVQVTAASVDGRLGRAARRSARELLELDLVHMIASDAHHPSIRDSGLAAAADAVGDSSLSRWLTVDVPRAIVDQMPLPPRPGRRRRRLRLA
jgi:protein-tyrosine phosphatase